MPSQPPGGGGDGGTGTTTGVTTQHTLSLNGVDRTFLVHMPPGNPNTPVPVLFVMHGWTMSGQIMEELTGFDTLSDSEHFVVAYPDGEGFAPWNAGQNVCGGAQGVLGNQDDIQFVKDILDEIASTHAINRSEVFLTGFSMGAYFANHIACQEGHNLLRAVAPHSGGTYDGSCPGAPVPMLILHGTSDGIVPPDCGSGARDLWAQRNGCSSDYDTIPVMGGHCEVQRGCPPGGQVELCLFDNMPHGWAGASQSASYGLYAGGTQYQSATQLIWSFFKQQM